MNVYLVEDIRNSPGRIYGVFAEDRAAHDYADQIEHFSDGITAAQVVEFPLWYGQRRFQETPIPAIQRPDKRLKGMSEDMARDCMRRLMSYEGTFLGVAEIAHVLGESKQNITNKRKRGRLPKPYQELAMSPIWTKEQVEVHIRNRGILAQEATNGTE